jgi:hypothetical protein
MKALYDLTDADFIEMAKLIDNEFRGNKKIDVSKAGGTIRVIGHTDGGQCINCDVKFIIKEGLKLTGVYTQNDDEHSPGAYRMVYPPTLKKIIDYLKEKDFDFTGQ